MASSPARSVTRAVAVLKPPAVKHRLTIEPRLLEAGFEIVKERQMEFHPVEDALLLLDLFGHEGVTLTPGPIWVYVLERRRAIEVLCALMGHEDPELARSQSPKSLRAIYGRSRDNNAIYGSTVDSVAERQISVLFASSPPFSAAEIPLPLSESDLVLKDSPSTPISSRGRNSVCNASDIADLSPQSTKDGVSTSLERGSNASFRSTPHILPRANRASLLRTGGELPPHSLRIKRVPSSDADALTFADVPGHKYRSAPVLVASVAPPTNAPRHTRASALRTGQSVAPTPVREKKPVDYGNTPGHKRSQTFTVASVQPPAVPPRLNRSATLRTQRASTSGTAPKPLATAPKDTTPKTPSPDSLNPPGRTLPRISSASDLLTIRPTASRKPSSNAPPSAFRAPAAAVASEPNRIQCPSTAEGNRPGLSSRNSMSSLTSASGTKSASDKPRPPSALSRPPSITPRTNKSAALRASMGSAQSVRDLTAAFGYLLCCSSLMMNTECTVVAQSNQCTKVLRPALRKARYERSVGLSGSSMSIPLFPCLHREAVLACQLSSWYPRFASVSVKTVTIRPLTAKFRQYLEADGIHIPAGAEDSSRSSSLSDEESESESEGDVDPARTFVFPELDAEIRRVIADFGAVFPKLNWSSPKDAAWMLPQSSPLKCTSPADVYLLLKSSDFVGHDLDPRMVFEGCDDDSIETDVSYDLELSLRKWYPIDKSREFRCFVRNDVLLGISQRDVNYYDYLNQEAIQDRLVATISEFWRTCFQPRWKASIDYIFDVLITRDLLRAHLIDVNPYAPRTDPLLLSYEQLQSMGSTRDAPLPVLAVVDSRSHPSATRNAPAYQHNMIPFEAVALSNGQSPEAFGELLADHVRESAAASANDNEDK